jgi:hypothetical protein
MPHAIWLEFVRHRAERIESPPTPAQAVVGILYAVIYHEGFRFDNENAGQTGLASIKSAGAPRTRFDTREAGSNPGTLLHPSSACSP